MARVCYTTLGDEKARATSARALERAAPFLRRQIGARLRLKRTPELKFVYDDVGCRPGPHRTDPERAAVDDPR